MRARHVITHIVHGKHPNTHLSQISPVSAKIIYRGPYLDMRYLRTVYAIAILTSVLHRANSTL